ncbi:MAG: putative conserved domain protein [uncultured Solirubrobacteraceae bacterium]|uniref:Putative conserved domain protein n=1 Tax=uncultured Solirubrobacteraceae bacterium TaxID=1162706 RepID=A0A6J4RSY7_9ACTN|nr:MAG: putative conserved domain protein [uncultured Solirubrobacteraceae bacterium]
MPTLQDVKTWRGQDVVGPDGSKIGTLDHIYLDRQSGEPTFGAVKTGLFGTNVSLVPLEGATGGSGSVQLPFDKQKIKDAPNIDADAELSEAEEQRLYEYYGVGYSQFEGEDRTRDYYTEDQNREYESRYAAGTVDTDRTTDRTTDRGVVGDDVSGQETDDAMTRSEEELRVGKTSRETGRARLRKYIVSEDVQTTVPVQREEVRVEREPITDANVSAATDGPALSEEEHEVTLHAEQPVVQKDVRPVERVRLDKDTVTEEVQVNEQVRKEQIEMADAADSPREGIDGQRGTDEGIR